MSEPVNEDLSNAAKMVEWLENQPDVPAEQDKLNEALALAQAEMPNAVLNKVNPHFHSHYADLASIREATLPSLTKNGLSILQYTMLIGDKLELRTRLSHKSGQWIEGSYPIALDRPQAMGSALTYARRYCWAGMCGVGFEEDDDANAAEGEGPKSKAESRKYFTALIDIMRDAKTQQELTECITENMQIYENLPDDWKRDIKKEGDRLRKLLPQ